jgi:hypothetical protein
MSDLDDALAPSQIVFHFVVKSDGQDQAEAPHTVLSHRPGIYYEPVKVTLTSTPGATIHWTTDGSTPAEGQAGTTSSSIPTAPLSPSGTVDMTESTTLKYFATMGETQEPSQQATFIVSPMTKTLYVRRSVTGSSHDGSAANPYVSLQQAIDAAADGTRIVVEPGIYAGNTDVKGKRVHLLAEQGAGETIIDCKGEEGVRGFILRSGETAGTVIEGFTILNGNVDEGGAIYVRDSSPTLLDCVFKGCKAEKGGALYITGACTSEIRRCHLLNNEATQQGGGLWYGRTTTPRVRSCQIQGNRARSGAGVFGE